MSQRLAASVRVPVTASCADCACCCRLQGGRSDLLPSAGSAVLHQAAARVEAPGALGCTAVQHVQQEAYLALRACHMHHLQLAQVLIQA